MADYFCDQDAYLTAYSNKLGDIPTLANWAVPQEGDGSGKYAATVSSTASITINGGVAAAAGNTVIICGVTFTGQVAARTAGTATFTVGGTAQSTADGLAAAINDCTTAVSSGAASGVPRISNLIYARGPTIRGDTNAVVDLMMRVGSASLNYAAPNTAVLITSASWANAPTVSNFAGGVGGCWGVLCNTAALGVGSNYAIAAYGVASSNIAWRPMVAVNASVLTTQALNGFADIVWVRSRNGYRLSFTGGACPQFQHTFHENIVLDSNTKWTEDSGNGQVELYVNCNGQSIAMNFAWSSCARSLSCVKQYALRILIGSTGGGNGNFQFATTQGGGGSCGVHNIYIGEERDFVAAGWATPTTYISVGGNYINTYFSGCMLDLISQRSATSGGFVIGGISGTIAFDDCVFNANFVSAIDPGPVCGITVSSSNSAIKFRNCQFKGAPASQGYQYRAMPTATSLGYAEVVFENCTGLKLDTYIGFQTTQSGNNPALPSMFISSADTGRAFRHENVQGVADWNPLASPAYPLLVATQPDGTRWSMKVDWLYYTAIFGANEGSPYTAPRMSLLYRDTLAVRTITLDLMVKSTLAMTALNSAMRVSYTDANGVVRSESTRLKPAAFLVSGAVWDNASNFPNHIAKKFVLTTTYAIKPNTEVSVYLNLFKPSPSGVADQLFVDPEFKIV